ncbi:MAG: hypothetical protein GY719_03735 [bacterium]|nr:hypothetical protein [bacterium]
MSFDSLINVSTVARREFQDQVQTLLGRHRRVVDNIVVVGFLEGFEDPQLAFVALHG